MIGKNIIALNLSFKLDRPAAVKVYREVLEEKLSVFKENHLQVLYTRHDLAISDILHQRLQSFQDILEVLQRSFGETHSFILQVRYNIGMVVCNSGRYRESLSVICS